jgi:putative endonuclease
MFERLRTFVSALSRGDEGERIARRFLCAKPGWRLVARNWRNPRDRREELDLVMRDREILVFVEVKARAAGARVGGYYAVDRRKKAALRRAITAYVAALREKPRTVRFDVVEVTLPADRGGRPGVMHFENIPLLGPGWRP